MGLVDPSQFQFERRPASFGVDGLAALQFADVECGRPRRRRDQGKGVHEAAGFVHGAGGRRLFPGMPARAAHHHSIALRTDPYCA